ncbi:M48 family metallopeptidase [uncultured Ramlibacter sp.]|uniref:M48 family metallopeptidase n=1 Tax=uncultured Ramlibacter sp. TaxID=260755 RepID=UPI002629390A|nr:SprT family zinc-dependent metalloprotease [uncultured Ramlibacter sp.]
MRRLLQLTLDLFDTAAPVPAPGIEENKAVAPGYAADPAIKSIAIVAPAPAEQLDQVIGGAHFRHPQAAREALLGQSRVAFALRRARRRTIGFSVDASGLTVTAPKWVPLYEIDAAVKSKAAWILRKLDETAQRQQRIESARIAWRDGASFPFLGETVILVLDPRHAFSDVGGVLNTDAQALPGVPRLTLHIGLPHTATAEQIRDAVQAWLMRQAKRLFTERLDHYAPLLGVQWRKLSLSSAGTRWGTANADGGIRLNWRLVHFRMPVIDYVVAHELSHLRVMDHSPRFWDTVRTVVPDYAQLRGQLRDEALPSW